MPPPSRDVKRSGRPTKICPDKLYDWSYMASTTRRSKAARADRKTEIEERMREAIAKLVANGERFTELSVERLVSEAGMARSTFYVYFEDKGALLRAIGSSTLHAFYEGARPWLEKRGGVSHEDIKNAMRGTLDAFHENEVVMAADRRNRRLRRRRRGHVPRERGRLHRVAAQADPARAEGRDDPRRQRRPTRRPLSAG